MTMGTFQREARLKEPLPRTPQRGQRPPRQRFFPRRQPTQPLQHQKTVGQRHQAGVMVETTPGAALEMIQPQLFIHLLVALLHTPATLPPSHGLQAGRWLGQVRESVLDFAVVALLNQQPHRLGMGAVPGLPVVSWPNTYPGEAGSQ